MPFSRDACWLLTIAFAACLAGYAHANKARVVILADMGNEPDEEQQMTHMLVNCNEFELRGLIAVTGMYLREDARDPYKRRVHPELFDRLIDGYAKVLPNLRLHAEGWPDAEALHALVCAGQPEYGTDAVGVGQASPGARALAGELLRDDPRPLWVVVNAGSNTLAQALFDLREQLAGEPERLSQLVAKLRVFENGAQDNAGAWVCHEFPSIHWLRSNYQTYAYGGPARGDSGIGNLGPHCWRPYPYSSDGQHQWLKEHVQTGHGALGELYPDRRFGKNRLGFMEGGGSTPWLGLVNRGLFDLDHPHWGGWGGRFTREKVTGEWSRHEFVRRGEQAFAPFAVYRAVSDVCVDPDSGKVMHGDYVPVWRWRPAMLTNLQCRMDWCVKPFDQANHHPAAAVGDDGSDEVLYVDAQPGETLTLDATASTDPDGDDLVFSWWQYQEAGAYAGQVAMEGADRPKVRVRVPTGAPNAEIHLVLEVRDANPIASLYDYRRIVVTAREPHPAAEP